MQLSARAIMRAVVVLPTPRTPVRMKACASRPDSKALVSVRTIASCRKRTDIPEWTPDGAAWEVTLVVLMPDAGILPEPPTLWGAA